MISKHLLLVVLAPMILLSCKKNDNKQPLDFETVLKSHTWTVSLYGELMGTQDPDSTNYPFYNYTNPCDSNTLFTFNADSSYTKHLIDNTVTGCTAFIATTNSWEYSKTEFFLRFIYIKNGTFISSYGFKIKDFSDDEIYLYNEGIGFDDPVRTVDILKLHSR